MLPNAYFLATFGFDTAENEPAKNLQDFSRLSIQAEYKVCLPPLSQASRRTMALPGFDLQAPIQHLRSTTAP